VSSTPVTGLGPAGGWGLQGHLQQLLAEEAVSLAEQDYLERGNAVWVPKQD